MTVSREDGIRGCLLGGAVGDALGAAVEFDSIDGIRARFGSAGIRDFAEAYGRRAEIEQLADDWIACFASDQRFDVTAPEWWRRYPGW